MSLLTKEQEERVVAAIKAGEKRTSAEIKVHIDKRCTKDPLDVAVEWFARLGMHKTELRNGVLIYVAHESRKMAIIGDKGINDLAPNNFWDSTYTAMREEFASENYCEGLTRAINSVATLLAEHFPYQADDINELDDDISYGN